MFATAAEAMKFATGGDATLTVESLRTGTHFTFRLRRPKAKPGQPSAPIFVSALTGPDNTDDFRYFGFVRDRFRHGGAKAKIGPDAPCAKAFVWVWNWLCAGTIPAGLQVYHDGCCGRCGRKLTTPESLQCGFGPECVKHV